MEAVSATNEALTLLYTLRDLCRSISNRIENFRENREQFRVLKDELSNVAKKVSVCHTTLEKYSRTIVTESLEYELIDLGEVVQTMERVEESVKDLEEKLPQRRRFFKEFSNSNRIAQDISHQEQVLRELSSRIHNINEKIREVAKENDFFSPDFSTIPNLRHSWSLDFSTQGTMEGEIKAKLLECVRNSKEKKNGVYDHLTAVVGVAGMGGVGKTTALAGIAHDPDVRDIFSSGVYFLTVGKDATSAKLVKELKEMIRRSGGERWCEKIDNNGGLGSAVRITSSWFRGRQALFILDDLWGTPSSQLGYLEEMAGLLDDSPESHMLISTRSSTIAFETSARIEFKPREETGFAARGIFLASAGLHDTSIQDTESEELLEEVLKLCGGVPLMLSIAGAQVRGRAGTHTASLRHLLHSLDDERVILPKEQPGQYPSCFNQTVKLSLETIADVLKSSTKFMESWNEQLDYNPNRSSKAVLDFVINCFHRLCILPRNARVSKDIIFAIWGSPDKTVAWSVVDSLVDFHLFLEFKDGQGKSTFGLHDVILDYCEKASQVGGNRQYELYHDEFLSHAWSMFHQGSSNMSGSVTEETWEACGTVLDAFWVREACEGCRPWWRVLSSSDNELSDMKSYLLDNLHRHLKESSRFAEAVGVLSHMGWTKMRVAQGSIVALNTDYSMVESAIRLHPRSQQDCKACDETLHGISNIWNMLKKAWPVLLNNSEALPAHAYGYLLDKENELPLVERYLQSASDIVTNPWFKPKSAFWQMLESSSSQQILRFSDMLVDISSLNNSQIIIVATKYALFWVDQKKTSITREMVIKENSKGASHISAFALCETKGILVIGLSTGGLEFRDEKNGNIRHEIINGHARQVMGVAVSADGRAIVSGSLDNTIRIWDMESGTPIGEPLRGHERSVYCVAMDASGRTIVSGSNDKTVRLWDRETRTAIGEPLRGHEGRVMSVDISADGRRVVSGSIDRTIRLWDAESGTPIGEPLLGHDHEVYCVTITTDGRTVASGSIDGTVRLWNAESGAPIGEPLRGHYDSVFCITIGKNGKTVSSGSADKTVRTWDVESRKAMREVMHDHGSSRYCVTTSKGGRITASGSIDTTVRLWDVENQKPFGEPLYAHEKLGDLSSHERGWMGASFWFW